MSLALFAAEQSGEQLAVGLLSRLQRPAFGMGGTLLEEAGLECIARPPHVMGILEVAPELPKICRTFYTMQKAILQRNPSVVITVDSPALFLPLHRWLRRRGYRGKLIHWVSPSVWAWRSSRIRGMAKTLDLLICLLPFESSYYQPYGLPTLTIDHPLAHHILTQEVYAEPKEPILALFPGSRPSTIRTHLPILLEAARSFPHLQPVVCLARESLRNALPAGIKTIDSTNRYHLLRKAQGALATMGTIALECALQGTPTVAIYQPHPTTFWMGRSLFRICLPHFALPNLMLQKELIPEHVHPCVQPVAIAHSLRRIWDRPHVFDALVHTLRGQFSLITSPFDVVTERVIQFL